jgi:hypothetical protein
VRTLLCLAMQLVYLVILECYSARKRLYTLLFILLVDTLLVLERFRAEKLAVLIIGSFRLTLI